MSKSSKLQQFIQVSKAARALDCSHEYVFKLIADGKLVAINLGQRMTRVNQQSLLDFITRSKINPADYFKQPEQEK